MNPCGLWSRPSFPCAVGVRPIVVIGCDHGACVGALQRDGTNPAIIALSLPCSAALPPAFVEFAQRAGASTVVVADCGEHACTYRFGAAFTRSRLSGEREPHLRSQARSAVHRLATPAGCEEILSAGIARLQQSALEHVRA